MHVCQPVQLAGVGEHQPSHPFVQGRQRRASRHPRQALRCTARLFQDDKVERLECLSLLEAAKEPSSSPFAAATACREYGEGNEIGGIDAHL